MQKIKTIVKKFPLTIIPILGVLIIVTIFFFLPEGADIISPDGDWYLGAMFPWLFLFCGTIDYMRFKKK